MITLSQQIDYTKMSQAQLIEIIETQKILINELRWHDENMSNTNLPIDARFAARGVRKFILTRQPCHDGYFKAYLPKMAELAGTSTSTISRGLKTLSDATEALDKYTDEILNEKGHVEKNVLYFRTHEIFDQAPNIRPTKELPKHGGDHRLPCPECGCPHRRRKVVEECAACAHKFYENERIIRGDEEPLQDATDTNPIIVDFSLVPTEPLLQLATFSVYTPLSPCNEPEELSPVASCNGLPPDELRALPIWCPWRYEPQKDKQGNIIPDAKPNKVPYQVGGRSPQKAMTNEPKTWATYDAALRTYEEAIKWNLKEKFDGIGLMCDGSFVGIDLDHCRNKETGEIAPWAQAIIDRFSSYGYITPSEEGVRIIIRGEKPGPNCKKGDTEIYEEKRFFTWTPMQLPGTPATIEDGQEQLTALYSEIWPVSPPKEAPEPVFTPACPLEDDEVLAKAQGATNGAKFQKLWSGDASNYRKADGSPDNSSADLALCAMLAYWTGRDPVVMDRLFRQSGLYRAEKWDRKARAGETYGEGTIKRAIGGRA